MEDDDNPKSVLDALFQGNFMPYLDYYSRQGSNLIGVTLDAIGNLYGVDFELYDEDSFVPHYVWCCNEDLTMD